MRVLHIISSPAAGGAEMYVKDLAVAMRKKGVEVFILFISHAKEINRSQDFEIKFIQELLNYDIHYDFIGNSCKKNPFKGILKLHKVVNHFKPEVIHSHLYYGAIFSLFITNVKKIYTHHNIELGASKHIYKILNIGISAYIGICNACQELLKPLTSKRVVVKITNGVDINRVHTKQASVYLPKKKILMAGRLTEQKNYQLILEALVHYPALNIELFIAGEGPTRKFLQQYVIENKLSDKVFFLGNRDDLPELMAKVDIFAMSSAWEGLPIALIEATLTGLPVIVTDVGGCAEIVADVGNGVIVTELDARYYGEKLYALVSDDARLSEYSENARQRSAAYTIDSAVKEHIKVYTQIT